jgi:hypothetical protein
VLRNEESVFNMRHSTFNTPYAILKAEDFPSSIIRLQSNILIHPQTIISIISIKSIINNIYFSITDNIDSDINSIATEEIDRSLRKEFIDTILIDSRIMIQTNSDQIKGNKGKQSKTKQISWNLN